MIIGSRIQMSTVAPDPSLFFAPLKVNGVELGNRFMVSSMQRGFAEGGAPTLKLGHYLAARAQGGFALVMSESCAVDHPLATSQPSATRLTGETAAAWAQVIADVQAAGGRMFMQLWHEGATRRMEGDALESISPSGLIRNGVPNGRAATAEDLQALVDAYVRSALLAKKAGADGVEIHACHGYLIDQFIWAETNQRTDEYGGPRLEDRLRFPAEIVTRVRQAIGPAMPLSIRLSQWKEADFDAITYAAPEDVRTAVKVLEEAGVDMFNISQRRFYKPAWAGDDRSLAGWFKAFTDRPVATNGSIGLDTELRDFVFGDGKSKVTARESLGELARRFTAGEFDLVSVGRASIGDGAWVQKVRHGDYSAIRPFDRADLVEANDWDTFAYDVGVK
jgi:2,4-dienoyl-CoA reductase-like NADH-dependent reductase (Old Yellow Enzyme family)